MKGFAGDLVQDLRDRRLLPVALLLLAAIVAVPLFLLKPSSASTDGASVQPPAPGAGASLTASLLQAGEAQPSDLDAFDAKDPFAAPRGAKPAPSESAPSGAGGMLAIDPSQGGAPAPAPGPEVAPAPPAAEPEQQEQRSFTYALDLTFTGLRGERGYRNLERLQMLPSAASPLIVFLGIEEGGGRAQFLVDATVTLLEGEGTCMPSRSECATLSLEPGEQQVFADEQGRRYAILVDQIRERDLSQAASATPHAEVAQPAGARRRFVPPALVDVVSEGQP